MSDFCFSDCPCSCGDLDSEFDDLIAKETNFPVRLDSLLAENIGWIFDKSLKQKFSDGLISSSNNEFGIYILWHKEDYCCKH
jgi:hypothetical protein